MALVNTKRTVRGWTFYDWANSVYSLVISSAIFPIFYEAQTSSKNENGEVINDVVEFFGFQFINTALYSYVVAFSFLVISVISPILSGIADYTGNKKKFLQFFCYLGSLACASMYFFEVSNLELGLLSVFFASIGYWGSLVFYNAYLPEIAPPEDQDKISAQGYALGYLGSSILLIICLIFIMFHESFSFESAELPTRISFIVVALWWVGFSQYTFRALPNSNNLNKVKGNTLKKGFQELVMVWNELKEQKILKKYLLSFFVFSMGVQTIMLVAQFFGMKEIPGMKTEGLIISILIIQFVAIAGAFLFSNLSKRIGNFNALRVALLIWVAITIGALFIQTPIQFYFSAAFVGLVMGGIQALSRSTYSKLLPKTQDHASYFSFYDILEKIGIVIGMFSYGFIEDLTGSMRNSTVALIVFFVLGLILMPRLPKSTN